MPDILEMLISGGSRDADMQKALAQGLRRRQEISELGQITGDRIITPLAQNIGADVTRQTNIAAQQSDKAAQRELTEGYYEQQAGQSALANTMAKQRLDETIRHNKEMENRQASTAANRTRTDTRNLARDLTKAQAPEISSGIAAINSELAPYLKDGGNIPGVGGMANILPGLFADSRTMQDRMAKIRNIVLKARSGGAVTPAEADRLLQEFSVRVLNTDEDFIRAWQDFTGAYETGIANIYAGYDDDVVETYMQNLDRSQAGPEQGGPGAPAATGVDASGWGF